MRKLNAVAENVLTLNKLKVADDAEDLREAGENEEAIRSVANILDFLADAWNNVDGSAACGLSNVLNHIADRSQMLSNRLARKRKAARA